MLPRRRTCSSLTPTALKYNGKPKKRGFLNVARWVLLPERAYVALNVILSASPSAFDSVSEDSYDDVSL